MYIVEKNTLLINDQVIQLQFFMWGIKLATRKIIPSQTLIIWGHETIQTFHGRDKAHTINKCHLRQITIQTLDYKIKWHMVASQCQGKRTSQANTYMEHLLRP